LLATACRGQRWRLYRAAALAATASGATVALLGLSGWFITAASAAGLAGAATAAAFNALLPSAGIRLLAILRTGCRYGERVDGHDAALHAMAALRPALFRALAAAPPSQAMALAVGDATARMVQDVGELETCLVQRISRWGGAAAGIGGVCLTAMAGVMPALALIGILATILFAARWLARRLDANGRAIPPAQGLLRGEVAALLAATPELRAYGLEEWAADRALQRSAALLAVQRRVTAVGGGFDLLLTAGAGFAALVVLPLAQPAGMALAALAALSAAASVEGCGTVLRVLQHRGCLQAATTRIGEVLTGQGGDGSQSVAEGMDLRIAGLSVPLRAGQVVGVVGPSGCGKTTLLETLVALRPARPGAVRLGGADLARLDPAWLRQQFALAPQDARLLAGTVRENLLLGAPGTADATLWDALHAAALASRVRGLPAGLDSWIGEGGCTLSGGERRRLVLARAYLRPAPWLLLDEPTEGLDAETESLVVQLLRDRLARHDQGAIIVSHRGPPLTLCDTVIEMAADGAVAVRQAPACQPA
jgi:ATP-binding cassette subfamily C protein CydC